MKKLILLIVMLGCLVAAEAQTIVDWPESVVFYHENGDSQSITKEHVAALDIANSKVVLLTTVGRFAMSTEEFGFDTDSMFFLYLNAIIHHDYYETYNYTSGNMDTITYAHNGEVQYYEVLGWTNDSLTSRKIVHP